MANLLLNTLHYQGHSHLRRTILSSISDNLILYLQFYTWRARRIFNRLASGSTYFKHRFSSTPPHVSNAVANCSLTYVRTLGKSAQWAVGVFMEANAHQDSY